MLYEAIACLYVLKETAGVLTHVIHSYHHLELDVFVSGASAAIAAIAQVPDY